MNELIEVTNWKSLDSTIVNCVILFNTCFISFVSIIIQKAHNFVNRFVFVHPCAKEVLDTRTGF